MTEAHVRLERMQRELHGLGVDAMLVLAPANTYYLSGPGRAAGRSTGPRAPSSRRPATGSSSPTARGTASASTSMRHRISRPATRRCCNPGW